MNKSILLVPTVSLFLALSAGSTLAGGTPTPSECQPIYGGGQTCSESNQFLINKTVRDPETNTFVDNLGVSNRKYRSNETVIFKITVKNSRNTALRKVVIKDTLPEYIDFVDGKGGTFDAASNTLTINLGILAKQESRDFFIEAKVKPEAQLPKDQDTVCVINQSIITVGTKTNQDNAQFCIEKGQAQSPAPTQKPKSAAAVKGGVAPTPTPTTKPQTTKGGLTVFPPTKAKTTPETGPESLALFGLIPSAIGGFFLRRKTR